MWKEKPGKDLVSMALTNFCRANFWGTGRPEDAWYAGRRLEEEGWEVPVGQKQ